MDDIDYEREYKLADQLREKCDSERNEKDPKETAKILYEIGLIYFKRNENTEISSERLKVNFIKSAALLNAAITREPDNVQNIKKDLKILCCEVLKQAGAEKLDADLIKVARNVNMEVKRMREKVNRKIVSMDKLKDKHKSDEERENRKVQRMKHLQEDIASDYSTIMNKLLHSCERIKGTPPCKFAMVGMGSLARKEITPYSDFEHIIVLEEEAHLRTDYETILEYFRWLSVIFQIIIINLNETIVSNLDIESLKAKTNKKVSLFHDSITTRGICFDGMMPHACMFPMGHQVLSGKKPFKAELIKSIEEMLKYLVSDQDLKSGYHLKDILTKICHVGGDENVFCKFQTKVYDLLDNQDKEEQKNAIADILVKDLDSFATRSNFLDLQSRSFNVKKDLYRSITIFILALGRVENIHASSCFDIVEELAEKGKIDDKLKRKLMYAVALGCEIRLRRYMKRKRQDDEIKEAKNRQEAIQILEDGVEISGLISYFQIAYALQCHVSKRFDLKKLHFYSDPRLLNCKLYYCFGSFQKFVNFFEQSKEVKQSQAVRLQAASEIIDQLENEAKLHKDDGGCSAWNQNFKFTKEKLDKIINHGIQISKTGNNDDAREIFEMVIEATASESKQNDNLSTAKQSVFDRDLRKKALDQSAACYLQLNKPAEALIVLEQSLKIKEDSLPDVSTDIKVASTLNNIGNCLLDMHKPDDGMVQYKKSLKIFQKASKDISTDIHVADLQNNIAVCYERMYKSADAIDCLKQALEIYKKVSLDVSIDVDVALTQNNMAMCFKNLHKLVDAMNYLKKSLEIKEKLPRSRLSDFDMASTLNNMGCCFLDTHRPVEAMNYLQRSLIISKSLTLDISTDINGASTMNNIGLCYVDLNESEKATESLQQSLNIKEKASLGVSTDTSVAETLNNIGLCFREKRETAHAIELLQRSEKIYEAASQDNSKNTNLASVLNNIGLCFMDKPHPDVAMKYLEDSLKISRNASQDSSSDANVASTLNNLGVSLMNMHKPVDAMGYLQQSLEIFQKQSLEMSSDPNVDKASKNISMCENMQKHADTKADSQLRLEIQETQNCHRGEISPPLILLTNTSADTKVMWSGSVISLKIHCKHVVQSDSSETIS